MKGCGIGIRVMWNLMEDIPFGPSFKSAQQNQTHLRAECPGALEEAHKLSVVWSTTFTYPTPTFQKNFKYAEPVGHRNALYQWLFVSLSKLLLRISHTKSHWLRTSSQMSMVCRLAGWFFRCRPRRMLSGAPTGICGQLQVAWTLLPGSLMCLGGDCDDIICFINFPLFRMLTCNCPHSGSRVLRGTAEA